MIAGAPLVSSRSGAHLEPQPSRALFIPSRMRATSISELPRPPCGHTDASLFPSAIFTMTINSSTLTAPSKLQSPTQAARGVGETGIGEGVGVAVASGDRPQAPVMRSHANRARTTPCRDAHAPTSLDSEIEKQPPPPGAAERSQHPGAAWVGVGDAEGGTEASTRVCATSAVMQRHSVTSNRTMTHVQR